MAGTSSQDQYWADAAAFMVTVLVLDSTMARPVGIQVHGASLSCLLDLPRDQARRLLWRYWLARTMTPGR